MHTLVWIRGVLEIESLLMNLDVFAWQILRGYKDVIFLALLVVSLFSSCDDFFLGVLAK